MFIGRYYHTLESKGRLSLPKTFREIEKKWIITRGLDGGLFLFRKKDFNKELEQLAERTFTKKTHRDFIRLMSNEAREVQSDANGRVSLPEYLIKFGQLSKQVVVVGSYSYIEIWDQTKYHQYLDQIEKKAAVIAERITQAD